MGIKEKYQALVHACSNDDMLDIIINDMKSLEHYVNAVYNMEITIPLVLARYEGQDVRDRVEELDKNRNIAHERAILAVKRLNRFSGILGTSALFDGDVDDRYQVADFCFYVVSEVFQNRTGNHAKERFNVN